MTIVITGRIKSVGTDSVDIEDLETNKVYSCYVEGGQREGLKEGVTGLFLGYDGQNGLVVRKVNARKIIDPLYEEDLMRASTAIPTIALKNSPFKEVMEMVLNG